MTNTNELLDAMRSETLALEGGAPVITHEFPRYNSLGKEEQDAVQKHSVLGVPHFHPGDHQSTSAHRGRYVRGEHAVMNDDRASSIPPFRSNVAKPSDA